METIRWVWRSIRIQGRQTYTIPAGKHISLAASAISFKVNYP
jgi:hypothetical protein